MNQAHFHLILNHFPIIGLITGTLVILVGLLAKKSMVTQTGLFIVLGAALLGIPTFLTGEGAEEIVEKLGSESDRLIHEHEELAELFIWVLAITGVFALFNLYSYWKHKSWATKFSWLVLGASLVSGFIAQQVGSSGGEIRHTEIRNDFTQSNNTFQNNKTQDDD